MRSRATLLPLPALCVGGVASLTLQALPAAAVRQAIDRWSAADPDDFSCNSSTRGIQYVWPDAVN